MRPFSAGFLRLLGWQGPLSLSNQSHKRNRGVNGDTMRNVPLVDEDGDGNNELKKCKMEERQKHSKDET